MSNIKQLDWSQASYVIEFKYIVGLWCLRAYNTHRDVEIKFFEKKLKMCFAKYTKKIAKYRTHFLKDEKKGFAKYTTKIAYYTTQICHDENC